ncbi:MAG: radical SAM protein [Candidatus Aenigmarchaeota archaeon]|nr:radical SAM protein [Candidatus Aenigmarchaeota archaeon]MDW8160152.1 radical SAM protein [Candidatus Aenigmarchaeota archaeon]
MITLEKTESIDENFYYNNFKIKPIDACYFLENGKIFLEKANGTIERIGTEEYWERVKKFEPKKEAKISGKKTGPNDCGNCGLCNSHKNKTALLNIVVTNRCNLRCWYCFFYSERKNLVYEPSIEEIKKMLETAKQINGYVPPVQLTGGEPTLRKDLLEIIKTIKNYGCPHIQLNTNSVSHGIDFYENEKNVVENLKKLKKAGLNTIYTSFDGLKKRNNIKNHYEIAYALEAYRRSGIASVVLVPTISQQNLKEVNDIIRYAAKNIDIVRGVNFQPISIVGMVPKEERNKLRATQSDIVEELYEIGITYEDLYPVSAVEVLADLIGGNEPHVTFYNSEKCGLATYLFVEQDGNKIYPITNYIEVDSFLSELTKTRGVVGKLSFLSKVLPESIYQKGLKKGIAKYLEKYIIEEELPNGINLKKIVKNIIEDGNYESLGEFHKNTLFVGMMHFMDPYNYDIRRVQRCSIHYASQDGRLIPFCFYNVFPEIYRDKIIANYSKKDEKLIEEERTEFRKVLEFRKQLEN